MMALGWLVVTLDMPLYMILEGRAFWPVFLKRAAIRRQLNRLRRIERDTIAAFGRFNRTRAQEDERAYQELGVLLREYPMDKDGHYIAPFPTRLGNLIHAFETYPDVRYGADAVFYWPRLLMKMDKDAREDLDTRQALPDSAVYASVALLITGVLWTGYAAGKIFSGLVAARWPELTAAASPFAIPLPSATACCMVALISYVCAAIVYRASLYTNSQYGEVFKAAFDLYMPLLNRDFIDASGIVAQVASVTRDTALMAAPRRRHYEVVWRYLHNYRVQCPHCMSSFSASEVSAHTCRLGATRQPSADKTTNFGWLLRAVGFVLGMAGALRRYPYRSTHR
jgi:hypothetical protein